LVEPQESDSSATAAASAVLIWRLYAQPPTPYALPPTPYTFSLFLHLKHLHLRVAAAEHDLAEGIQRKRLTDEVARVPRDDDLIRLRDRRFDARGGVDDVAEDREFAALRRPDVARQRLAAVDRDAHPDRLAGTVGVDR